MALVKINVPPGTTPGSTVTDSFGNKLTADVNGQAVFDDTVVSQADLLAAGFQYPANASGSTAQRPTTNVYAGLMFFDTTLGKPVFRNGANSGWVDATGAGV